jgi:hypothetical protein
VQRQLDADRSVGLAGIALLGDLDVDAHHRLVVLLQPRELLLDVSAKRSDTSQ